MGNTPNWNIYYAENGAPADARTESATQAGTIETALDQVGGDIGSVNNFGVQYFANASARDLALTNPQVGWLSQLGSELFMRRWDGSAWKPYGAGLYPIKPSSVSGTGVSIDTDGAVVATSAASPLNVGVNGVFSTDFRNYQIHWLVYGASATFTAAVNLRAGGTDNSTGYDSVAMYGQNSVSESIPSINSSAWTISSQTNQDIRIFLSSAALNSQTTGTTSGFQTPNAATAANSFIQTIGLLHRASYQADGFRVALTNSATGLNIRIRIFGEI